ncbi:hypothetical protein HZY83_06060 [Gemella sp. GH3]|uniref:mucin-binding protein n=1 Tax=unclassified Gemella TaxID=2624949 RepID=UPI0015CF91EF|nr:MULTISPECIES: hypothetical protein [unclassified Gemella]MBF0714236.1 hypothetical protein [Gemella sp. GH3.1]NYS51188.1 hypothetical protein [Gemella sp. GH3]
MKNKKSFNWHSMKQRYSLRKYHFELDSVFLGAILLTGEEVPNNPDATNPDSMKKAVTRTVTYYTENADGTNRQQVDESKIPTKTDTIYFKRTGTINLVTGEVTFK